MGFVISLLQGEPQTWAHRLLETDSVQIHSLLSFFEAMAQLYEDPQRTATAESALFTLQQGRRPAEDYVTVFRRWSADTQWNNAALCHQFRMGLSEGLKDELAWVGMPDTLEDLITLTIQIDRRLHERWSVRSSQQTRPMWMTAKAPVPASHYLPPTCLNPVSSMPDTSEPMQLGLMRPTLPPEE